MVLGLQQAQGIALRPAGRRAQRAARAVMHAACHTPHHVVSPTALLQTTSCPRHEACREPAGPGPLQGREDGQSHQSVAACMRVYSWQEMLTGDRGSDDELMSCACRPGACLAAACARHRRCAICWQPAARCQPALPPGGSSGRGQSHCLLVVCTSCGACGVANAPPPLSSSCLIAPPPANTRDMLRDAAACWVLAPCTRGDRPAAGVCVVGALVAGRGPEGVVNDGMQPARSACAVTNGSTRPRRPAWSHKQHHTSNCLNDRGEVKLGWGCHPRGPAHPFKTSLPAAERSGGPHATGRPPWRMRTC